MYSSERSLVAKHVNDPFVIIGVNSDRDRDALKEVRQKEGITWRSFWDGDLGTKGPIAVAWNVHAWPTIYVIDAAGVIRFKNVRNEALDKAVDTLLDERLTGRIR
jgi:hypothetical protein